MAETNITVYDGNIVVNNNLTVDTNTFHVDALTDKVGIGTTQPSQKLEVDGTLKATSVQIGNVTNAFIPYGTIILWYGNPAALPTGWVLCDGTNSTPNLRDKFVLGAGNTYAKDNTGGSANKTLATANLPVHSHTGNTNSINHNHSVRSEYGSNQELTWIAPGGKYLQISFVQSYLNNGTCRPSSHSHSYWTNYTGSGSSFSILPPYYCLAYIMKV
jgi:microcystin-dependent protein